MQDLPTAAPDLSVAIITLNEEMRIGACLKALPPGAEIIVLDSGSTDRTCLLAESLGARVATRAFTDYAEQKNAALALATRGWILSLDADEVLSPQTAAALAALTGPGRCGGPNAYRLKRRLVFLGRRLRFGKAVDRPVRLVRRGAAKFSAAIHERLEVEGPVGVLAGEALHYSYADLSDYFRRFNDYTSRIAANHLSRGRSVPALLLLCLRPWLEFIYRYILRLGFLDGYPGYAYALVSSLYTFVKYAKFKELAQLQQGRR